MIVPKNPKSGAIVPITDRMDTFFSILYSSSLATFSIERSMENVGKLELYKMEKNVSILSVIGYIAPLFGFLGTIVGMFQLFYSIASTGEYSISNIAGGIYVKMISSASGLIIGIIAYVGYRYLNSQIDKTTNKMEVASAEFIDIL